MNFIKLPILLIQSLPNINSHIPNRTNTIRNLIQSIFFISNLRFLPNSNPRISLTRCRTNYLFFLRNFRLFRKQILYSSHKTRHPSYNPVSLFDIMFNLLIFLVNSVKLLSLLMKSHTSISSYSFSFPSYC